MSEPNLAHSSWSAGTDRLDQECDADTVAAILEDGEPSKPRLNLRMRDGTPAVLDAEADLVGQRQMWQQEHEALLAELLQLRSLTQEQVERIQNLEQALDQSLKSLGELRVQVVDQQFLEAQLASTEEISNVQQQAITRLKLQLTQQQQALDAQFAEIQARDRTVQELLAAMETLTQAQKAELEHLRSQLVRDRSSVQSYRSRLETQLSDLQSTFDLHQQQRLDLESRSLSNRVLITSLEVWLTQAIAQVKDLSQQEGLQQEQAALNQLKATLQQACTVLQNQQTEPIAESAGSPNSPSDLSESTEQELATAQTKIEELETEIAKQVTTQAMLQHACQELEMERDRQQARIAELEHQATDMQEQILKQAKQSSEYEAAIQHWKDRYWSNCNQIQHLKETLEQAVPNPPAELLEMLAGLLEPMAPVSSNPPALAISSQSRQDPTIDLPEFLLRRRNYKSRRS